MQAEEETSEDASAVAEKKPEEGGINTFWHCFTQETYFDDQRLEMNRELELESQRARA